MPSIKILVGSVPYFPFKRRLIDLCNALNAEGYECTLYSKDLSYLDNCRFQSLELFSLEANDCVINYRLPLKRREDLYSLQTALSGQPLPPLKKNKLKYKLKRWWKLKRLQLKESRDNRRNKKPFLLCELRLSEVARPSQPCNVSTTGLEQPSHLFYDAVVQCPLIEISGVGSSPKPNAAAILSPIEPGSEIPKVIEMARNNGIERIYLAGGVNDPVYYQQILVPLLKAAKGSVQYYGCPNRFELLAQRISHLYEYSSSETLEALAKGWGLNLVTADAASKQGVAVSGREAVVELAKKIDLTPYRRSQITVILNGFRRGHNLERQIEALKNQTVKPDQILLWYNDPGDKGKVNYSAVRQTKAAVSNENWGVWSRFYYALNAKTKYVCVFDDDTIPGERWFENCLNTIKTHRGLLGTIGLIYHSEDNYYQHSRVGWAEPNEQVKQVDIVGHSWFFEREFLTTFCRELPLLDVKICGEDIHFSYTLQKYAKLNTYVPPHPKNDKSLWGSLKGWELGVDDHAISHQHVKTANKGFVYGVNDYFKACVSQGWQLLNFKK